jgi:hypothetical protein
MPGRPAQRPLATRPVARGGLDHLTEYRQARSWLRHEADPLLDTAALTAAQAAREIASALPSLAKGYS